MESDDLLGLVPDRSNEINLQPLIDKINAEITEHVEEQRKRLKHHVIAYEDHLKEVADKEIQRIKESLIEILNHLLKEPQQ